MVKKRRQQRFYTESFDATGNGWKIVVWAHGTTGVADKCAPSRKV
jgi:hypothetical protein